MSFKTAPKENLSRDAEQEWHDRTSRHDVTVPKCCPQLPNTAQVARVCHLPWPNHATWHGRATWHGQAVPLGCPAKCAGLVGVGRATWVRFRGTFVRRFSAAFLAFLALFSAKCYSSFRFFNKVPKNIERCYMS